MTAKEFLQEIVEKGNGFPTIEGFEPDNWVYLMESYAEHKLRERWISVEDRKPIKDDGDEWGDVLVVWGDGSCEVLAYKAFEIYEYPEPKHWMLLPPKP